jgi:branched-chain amino acid transport system ATP-binding protein
MVIVWLVFRVWHCMFIESLQKRSRDDEYILNIVDVTKTFYGVTALLQVNFGIKQGQLKALIGPNGAGKTTLLNILSGLLQPDSGHTYFRGQDLVGLKPDKIALLGISRTFQLVKLFTVNDATVLDNVMLGAHKKLKPGISDALFSRSRMLKQEAVTKEAAMEMLKFVELETEAEVSPSSLSFGKQRLLELARSLMAEPDLLLLDEPASGLNDAEVENFAAILSTIQKKGITILLVEHNMKLVMNIAEEIVVIDYGQKIAEGNPEGIATDRKVIDAYLG